MWHIVCYQQKSHGKTKKPANSGLHRDHVLEGLGDTSVCIPLLLPVVHVSAEKYLAALLAKWMSNWPQVGQTPLLTDAPTFTRDSLGSPWVWGSLLCGFSKVALPSKPVQGVAGPPNWRSS